MLIIAKVNIIVTVVTVMVVTVMVVTVMVVTVMVVTAAVANAVPITRGVITQNTHGSSATIGKNILALNQTLTQALVKYSS